MRATPYTVRSLIERLEIFDDDLIIMVPSRENSFDYQYLVGVKEQKIDFSQSDQHLGDEEPAERQCLVLDNE